MDNIRHLLFSSVLLMLSYSNISSQNLTLNIFGIDEAETNIIDSLSYKKSFINYKALNEEVLLFNKKLQNLGYIENKLLKTEKTNDSTYQSTFSLKQRFYTIYIYYNKKYFRLCFTIHSNQFYCKKSKHRE